MSSQQIYQCIQDCHQTLGQLHSLASTAPAQVIRDTLDESAHHLDMCIKECEYAARLVR